MRVAERSERGLGVSFGYNGKGCGIKAFTIGRMRDGSFISGSGAIDFDYEGFYLLGESNNLDSVFY